MPISGPNSYPATMGLFVNHWTTVNAQLAPHPLKLPDGNVLADFVELRGMIIADENTIGDVQGQVDELRQTLTDKKKAIRAELKLFREAVLGDIPNSAYAASLPTLPPLSVNPSRFLRPLSDAAAVWGRINAHPPTGFTPPLLLSDDLQLLDFNTILTNLKAAYDAYQKGEGDLLNARKQRDSNLPLAREWMVQYRMAVLARLSPVDPLRNSIPRYSPYPGATPKGVTNLLFFYTEATNAAKITFTPSASKNITAYELRYSPGAKYNPASEETIATLPPTGPFAFDFPLDFVATGTTALFKVYVLNATGNHRASKVMAIKRTAGLTLSVLGAASPPVAQAA